MERKRGIIIIKEKKKKKNNYNYKIDVNETICYNTSSLPPPLSYHSHKNVKIKNKNHPHFFSSPSFSFLPSFSSYFILSPPLYFFSLSFLSPSRNEWFAVCAVTDINGARCCALPLPLMLYLSFIFLLLLYSFLHSFFHMR